MTVTGAKHLEGELATMRNVRKLLKLWDKPTTSHFIYSYVKYNKKTYIAMLIQKLAMFI